MRDMVSLVIERSSLPGIAKEKKKTQRKDARMQSIEYTKTFSELVPFASLRLCVELFLGPSVPVVKLEIIYRDRAV
jgi:hypothetical protein